MTDTGASQGLVIKPVDRQFYNEHLAEALPRRILDVHTHIWRAFDEGPDKVVDTRIASWPERVAAVCSAEELLDMYRRMLPGEQVTPAVFGNPGSAEPVDVQNEFVRQAGKVHHLPTMALTNPEWSAERFEQTIAEGGFTGAKVYLTYAPRRIKGSEIRIFDFLPPHQLQVLNDRACAVILHIPRPGRLADPENLAQMVQIDREYPNAKVIIAHVGRAYTTNDIGDAFAVLKGTSNLLFDISANTNEDVFRGLLETVGPGRVLFGSDMPITRMRMRRICEQGRYVNLVPRGLYGDVSNDRNMREVDGPEADALTFFLYEELAALLRAWKTLGLGKEQLEDVFYHNAARTLGWSEKTA